MPYCVYFSNTTTSMRILSIVFLCFVFESSCAQKNYAHELLLTETRFALESQIHGLKWGFLHNMDSAALGIGAKGFVNLQATWKARPDHPAGVLQWKPTAAFWSEDGLFGLTTGPFFTEVPNDSVLRATGYFFTIWKRYRVADTFKFIVDAGVQMSKTLPTSVFIGSPVLNEAIPLRKESEVGEDSANTGKQIEGFKNKAVQQSLIEALDEVASNKSILLVSDYGKLQKSELNSVSALGGHYLFVRNNQRVLSNGVFYEWGELKETGGTKSSLLSGYYIQVWKLQGGRPELLAAVYKFNQPLVH